MKLKVFLSSRNNDKINIDGCLGDSLTDIRLLLKEELEKIKLFDKEFLDIRINEGFDAVATSDSYNTCLKEVKNSDFIIALYNGAAGWAPTEIDIGICHAELSTAFDISMRKTAIIDISKYFTIIPSDDLEKKRNKIFSNYIKTLNRFTNPLKLVKASENNTGFKDGLLKAIKTTIYNHLFDRIKLSNHYYNLSGNNIISLDWKKLKYTERDKYITDILKSLIKSSSDYSTFITRVFSIPDNMSVEDAKSFTGRPFLEDQEIIKEFLTNEYGPIHFIGVYGSATEVQVKNMIGFPDITTIREDFGIYVWEQTTHVQLIFFVDCKTPEAINSNFLLFDNWCHSTGEFSNIKERARARNYILKAINNAKKIAFRKRLSLISAKTTKRASKLRKSASPSSLANGGLQSKTPLRAKNKARGNKTKAK